MKESVNLFRTILNYQCFKNTTIILLLNKKDILKEKINSGRNPVKKKFPDCPDNDYESAETYFRELFLAQNPNPEDRDIHTLFTCAVDCNNIKVVTLITLLSVRYDSRIGST